MNMGAQPVIGIAGLGLVGRALWQRLADQGYAGIGYDVRESARGAFASQRGQAVGSLTDLARAAP